MIRDARILMGVAGLMACWVGVAAAEQAMTLSQALRQPEAWFQEEQGRRYTKNVLSWQSFHGSWPKNIDTLTQAADREPGRLVGTFDNGATRGEMRYLARAFLATGDAACLAAFRQGLQALLAAQYPSGGWPQAYPPGTGYARHITFNDGTMIGIVEFLREVAIAPDYKFLGNERAAVRRAVERGIACILACQIRVQGKLTVWCAQHDAVTLEPRPARSYELVSLSGAESAGILRFLMSLEDPSPGVVRAIEAGVAWFEAAKLTGVRQERVGGDKVIVRDPSAPPLWARFYEMESNRPFFCGRDGVKKYDLAEIEAERRNGYAWYGDWGRGVLESFAVWRKGVRATR